MLILSRDQVRRVDRIAIEQYGIPGVVLMENAGRSAAEEALKLVANSAGPRFSAGNVKAAIFCGGGNNGGDGYVIARHLHNAGVQAVVYAAADPRSLSGDAAINRAIVEKMHLDCREILDDGQLNAATPDLEQSHLLVDALLGTGFSGAVRPHLAAVIRRLNAVALHDKKVLAVDVPSGLDCDSGVPSNPTVRADVTVTFVAMKKGFQNVQAKPCLGRIVVAGIGAPREILDQLGS